MQAQARTASKVVTRGTFCALAALAACSSGGGGVDLGSGQEPDPATADFPVFYVKRTLPQEDSDDLRQMRDTEADADLYMRDRASASAPEINVTDRITGTDRWDVKDVEVSADGERVLFAMRGPLAMNPDEEEPPTWNVWEYDVPTDLLRRVIVSDVVADDGQDVAPQFLPDGRILFSSTRQRQAKAVLLDEGKPQYEAQNEDRSESAFVLHVMNADGSNIRQISFNQSNDRDPTVLANGRLLWSRWDHAPGRNGIHLYTANPDGTDLQLHYGAMSHATGTNGEIIQFVGPRELQDGRILALVRPFADTDFGGDLVIIDANTYVENTQPTLPNQGMAGPAQARATPNEVRTVAGPSPGGRFHSAYPLWDGTDRILVSWSQCRLLDTTVTPNAIVPCTDEALADPDATSAPPLYSVWMFDPADNTFRPLMTPTENVMVTDVVAAQPRPLQQVILDKVITPGFETELLGEGVGILHVRSVYDVDGVDSATPDIATLANPGATTADERPARFIRLEKPVSQPDDDVVDLQGSAFGATGFMREILGYAPVEPDGSVRIKVPANVAFSISVLDRDGRRISPIHRNWLQVRPAEVLECNGCHAPGQQRSHGRANLFASVNPGAVATGQPFPNTVATFSPDAGETMAQTRTRTSCTNDTPRCAALSPSVNVIYDDVWTDAAAAGRSPDAGFALSYGDTTFTTPIPTAAACTTQWSSTCRITINYRQHVQPLWDKGRQTIDPMNGTVLADDTCSRAGCHNVTDANAMTQVPAGQLDLRNVDSTDEPDHVVSYRELLFTDNEQVLNNTGQLEDRLVPGPVDPVTGQPTLVPVPVAPSMIPQNARGSDRFFARFAPGGTHAGRLSAAELRLISEWLDIGAQYFNNPFDPAAPVN